MLPNGWKVLAGHAEHLRSVVSVGGVDWYWPGLQNVNVEHCWYVMGMVVASKVTFAN